jgi:hypothetical protein
MMMKKLSAIAHVKDSSTIIDKETFRELFEKKREEEFDHKTVISRLNQIELNNAEVLLSQGLKDIYTEVKSHCGLSMSKVVSERVNELENNIVISQ